MSVGTAVTPPDFTVITDQIGAFGPPMIGALGTALGVALTVMAIKWGAPQITGFFKKNAK